MKAFDLLKFAESSQKVPVSLLCYETISKKEPGTFKVLLAHLFDFYFIVLVSCLMTIFLNESMKLFMVTKGLRVAYSYTGGFELFPIMFPATLMCYFFTSYLLNDGQTYGMYVNKIRAHMVGSGMQSSLRWTFFSLSLYICLGLNVKRKQRIFRQNGWGQIEAHDHLYSTLLEFKIDESWKLVENCVEEQPEEEQQLFAA